MMSNCCCRQRDVREAGDAGHVGEPAGVPDAGVPHAERGRRHPPQRAQRHHQPGPHHRRLPLRRLPGPLPRARHRLRRLPHRKCPHPCSCLSSRRAVLNSIRSALPPLACLLPPRPPPRRDRGQRRIQFSEWEFDCSLG